MTLRPSELTAKIDAAFAAEWQRTKGVPLPAGGGEDRRLLFAAVARGVLEYLKEKDGETYKTISVRPHLGGDATTWDVTDTDLDVVAG